MYTEWFGADTVPGQSGVYQIESRNDELFCHWNGEFWGWASFNVAGAIDKRHMKSVAQDRKWRGLKEKA